MYSIISNLLLHVVYGNFTLFTQFAFSSFFSFQFISFFEATFSNHKFECNQKGVGIKFFFVKGTSRTKKMSKNDRPCVFPPGIQRVMKVKNCTATVVPKLRSCLSWDFIPT